MSTQVDYDKVAATYDNRYAWNDDAGVKGALTRFLRAGLDRVQLSSKGSILRVDLRLYATTAWAG